MTPVPPRRLRATAVTITIAAASVLLIDAAGPIRPAIVLTFFLIAPGLAAVPHLSVDHAVGQAAVAVGVSVTALVLVSEALLYLGVRGAGWAFVAIASLTVLGCLFPEVHDRRGVTA